MKCAARVVGEVLKGVYLAAPPTPTTIFSAFMRFSIIILPRNLLHKLACQIPVQLIDK